MAVLWLLTAETHLTFAGSVRVLAGKESVDIGLLVKNARGPVCVPDYARPVPEGSGWQYSQALVGVLTQYKVRALRAGLSRLAQQGLTFRDTIDDVKLV